MSLKDIQKHNFFGDHSYPVAFAISKLFSFFLTKNVCYEGPLSLRCPIEEIYSFLNTCFCYALLTKILSVERASKIRQKKKTLTLQNMCKKAMGPIWVIYLYCSVLLSYFHLVQHQVHFTEFSLNFLKNFTVLYNVWR